MGCRNDPDDPRKCERCGEFLWVSEDGLFCGECGVTMPCTMRVLPISVEARVPGMLRTRVAPRSDQVRK